MENNRLIAEFMGVPCDKDLYTPLCPHTGETLFIPSSQMKYDTSWDWLMPVAQKIIDVYITIDEQDEQELQQSILHDKIDVVYRIVVEIIKSYNRTTDYNKVTYYDGQ